MSASAASAILRGAVVGTYALLALELLAFNVPSAVSTPRRLSGARGLRRLGVVLPAALIAGLHLLPLAVAIVPGLARRLLPAGPVLHPGAAFVAVPLLAGGRALSLAAGRWLRGHLARRPGALCTSGPFAWTRNPIVLGALLTYAGLTAAVPLWPLLAGFPLVALHLHRRVREEEALLARVHGAAYAAYARAVPRYLPRPPRSSP